MWVKKKRYNFIFGIDDAALIGGGLSALGSIAGGYLNSKGSSKNKQSPATPSPPQERTFREWKNFIYGALDPVHYFGYPDIEAAYNEIAKKKDWKLVDPKDPSTIKGNNEAINFVNEHYEKWGRAENRERNDPKTADSYENRIKQDVEYGKGVDTDYLNSMQGNTADYLKGLQGTTADRIGANEAWNQSATANTDEYVNALRGNYGQWDKEITPMQNAVSGLATSAPINVVGPGGFTSQYFTKPMQDAQGKYQGITDDRLSNQNFRDTGVYGAQGALGQLINQNAMSSANAQDYLGSETYGKETGLATLINQINKAHTPNEAQNIYQNWLDSKYNTDENRRYGLPTQSESGQLNPWGGVASGVSDLAKFYFLSQLQGNPNNNNNNQENTLYGMNNNSGTGFGFESQFPWLLGGS